MTSLINAYIDANLILAFAFAIWWLGRLALGRTALRTDHVAQLQLTEGILLALLLSAGLAPLVVWVHGVLYPGASLNAGDFLLAQFLQGRIPVDARQFETVMGLRAQALDTLAGLKSPAAIAVAMMFALGIALSLVRVGLGASRLTMLIRHSFAWRRFGRIEIRLSDRVSVPFSTRGLRRRYILLPTDMLERPDELRITLAHELQHMRRFDLEWEIALVLLRPVFFWNPAFALWKRQVEQLRELACDQAVLERRRISPRRYADCLLWVCDRSLARRGYGDTLRPSVSFLSSARRNGLRNKAALCARLMALSDRATRRARSGLCHRVARHIGAGCACLLISLGAASLYRTADWSQDRLMLSTVVNLERLQDRTYGPGRTGF